jgi:hypothetical protein
MINCEPYGLLRCLVSTLEVSSCCSACAALTTANYYCCLQLQGNLRFLHTRGALKSLRALSTLGADHAFLWPKYAAGRTFCTNMLDALLGIYAFASYSIVV